MSGNAKLLIAVFIVALAATSARAAKPKIITPREIDATSFEDAADGRQVRIMREEPKLAQKTVPLAARFVEADEMADAQEPIDEGAPVPPPAEGGGETFEPMLGLSNGSCGEWCDGDCADCSVPCDACDDCGLMDCGCDPYWRHRSYVFGQYLYFLPADADLSYAIQQNGVGGTGTVPYGQVGVLQPNFSSGFRTGFGVAVGCNATIAASYSNFRNHTTSQLTAPSGVGGTVNSLVLYPGTINAGSTNQLTTAGYDINYQLADIEYRRLIYGDDWHVFNYALGARYGKLSQQFSQVDNFASPTGVVQTASNINYEGVGFARGSTATAGWATACWPFTARPRSTCCSARCIPITPNTTPRPRPCKLNRSGAIVAPCRSSTTRSECSGPAATVTGGRRRDITPRSGLTRFRPASSFGRCRTRTL